MRPVCVLAAVLLAGIAAAPGTDPPGKGKSLRVLSYNIHHAEGSDGRVDLDRIAAVIKAADPDLVALQEVDRKTRRSGGADQAAELGKRTGLRAEFAKAIDYQGGEYGQAVLSRHPILSVKVHPLPGKAGQEARIAAETRIKPGGELPALTFVGTHFQHDDPATRVKQAAAVNDLFGRADGPLILAGDLNAVPGSEPIAALEKVWAFATPPGKGLLTIPADAPRRQIDYVLFRPAGRFRAVEAKVIAEAVASDHRPVLAVLELVP